MVLKLRALLNGVLLFTLASVISFWFLPLDYCLPVLIHFGVNVTLTAALLLTTFNLYRTHQKMLMQNEALLHSEGKNKNHVLFLETLLTNVPMVRFQIDPNGTITEAIGAGLKNMGLNNDETVGLKAFEIWPEYASFIRQALNGEAIHYEAHGIFNNQPWWMLFWMFPNPRQSDGAMGFAMDVTETRAAEMENARLGKLMQAVMTHMPIIAFRYNKEGIFTESQGQGLRRVNLKNNEIVGSNVFETYPDLADYFKRALEGEAVFFESEGVTHEEPWFYLNSLFPDELTEGGVMGIAMDITDLKLAEAGLRQSEEKLRSIMINAPDQIASIGTDLRFRYVNRILPGYQMEDFLGQSILEFTEESCRAAAARAVHEAIETGKPAEYEALAYGADKELTWYLNRVGPIIRDGQVQELTLISKDITELRNRQEQLRLSLREKETLLKEVQHRVKNNLQIIISLLNLQAGRFKDAKLKAAIDDTKNRVGSIAMVHNMLYETGNVSQICMTNYIQTLSTRVLHSYSVNPDRIHVKIDISDLKLEVDKAIPCGLMINEFLSNCLKHAFPSMRGEIQISMKILMGHIILKVSDNGIGAAPSILDSPSLGLRLVQTLTQQLKAELQLSCKDGVQWECRIPFKEPVIRNIP